MSALVDVIVDLYLNGVVVEEIANETGCDVKDISYIVESLEDDGK